jgi:hypothetical protein
VGSSASCSQDTSPPSYPLYSVGGEVSPSSFVAMTERAPRSGAAPSTSDLAQNGSRIGYQTLSTSDGASGPYFAWDSELSQQCLFEASGDGQTRCVPYDLGEVSSYFSDSTCSSPVLETSSTAAGLDSYAEAYSTAGCATGSFYSVGAVFTGTAYVGSASSCSATSASSSIAYYDLTPFAASGFESVTSEIGTTSFAGITGGSRLKLVIATGSDGVRGTTGWHDAQLGVDCQIYEANDGVTRCIPTAMAYASAYYADAECTQQLAYATGCPTPSYVETTATTAGCGGAYYSVGASYSGSVYYLSGTSCTATTLSLPTYRVGSEVPASTFVEVTLSH